LKEGKQIAWHPFRSNTNTKEKILYSHLLNAKPFAAAHGTSTAVWEIMVEDINTTKQLIDK
jgi:hypothetical protein